LHHHVINTPRYAGDLKGPPNPSQPPSPLRIARLPTALPGLAWCLFRPLDWGYSWIVATGTYNLLDILHYRQGQGLLKVEAFYRPAFCNW